MTQMKDWKWIQSGNWFCHGKVPAIEKAYTIQCEGSVTNWFKHPDRASYLIAFCNKCYQAKLKHESRYGAPMGIPKTVDSYERLSEEEAEVFIIMNE